MRRTVAQVAPCPIGSAPCPPASALAGNGRCRVGSSSTGRGLGYTLYAMPAILGIWTIRKSWFGRAFSESGNGLPASWQAETVPKGTRYATAVWDLMLHRFKLLIATAVPAPSRLRPSLAPGSGRCRVAGGHPTSGEARGARPSALLGRAARPGEPPFWGTLLDSPRSAVPVLRVPPCLSGGFAQLGSI